MTSHERADAIMERIRRIYDDYEEMAFRVIEEPDSNEAELIREIARADFNYNQIVVLYESDPAEFLEIYGGIDQMDDIDILMDWILAEEEKSSGEPETVWRRESWQG